MTLQPALIGGLGPWELGIILLLVLILFGAGKLPQVFESFGTAVKKFREAQRSDDDDDSIDVTPPKKLEDAPRAEAAEEERDKVQNG